MENSKTDPERNQFSLDFARPQPRQPRGNQPEPTSLFTPIMNLSTPELNKMISPSFKEELTVLTPNGIQSIIPQSNVLPSPLIPTTVDNSNNIINNTSNNNFNGSSTNNSHTHNGSGTHLNQRGGAKKSSSPDTTNSSAKKQNARQDMDVDKIEKKRERNRLAAKKCRQRKLETIDELRKEVEQLRQKYKEFQTEHEQFKSIKDTELDALREENAKLKSLLRSLQ